MTLLIMLGLAAFAVKALKEMHERKEIEGRAAGSYFAFCIY